MKRFVAAAVAAMFLFGGLAFAKGTAKEAQALVDKAIAYFNESGKDAAFEAINDPKGKFVKDDLYVYVVDFNGVVLAHGANKKLIGQHMIDLKDADGKLFVREIISVANTKGSGWVDYKWTNPQTKKVEKKTSFIKKNGNMIFICGIYK